MHHKNSNLYSDHFTKSDTFSSPEPFSFTQSPFKISRDQNKRGLWDCITKYVAFQTTLHRTKLPLLKCCKTRVYVKIEK